MPTETVVPMQGVQQGRAKPATWPAGWCGVLTHTHTYSGRSDHGGAEQPPRSYQEMAAWARRCGIAAVAMGSPYTAKAAATYERFENEERARYYSPDFDKRSVCDADELEAMLRGVAHYAGEHTLFFLDNETPKGRYGHMWWVGHKPDFPAWHDYDQPYDRWMQEQADPRDHGDEPLAYERRPYLEILAGQRAAGALGFWAHPTSWWHDEIGRFITNIATELPVHVMAEGFTDGMVIMGYHPYRPQYLALWYALLDRGYRVPGVAEMDVGLSDAKLWQRDGALLTYIRGQQGNLSVPHLIEGFRSGRMFVSSGPFIDLLVDDQPMGQVVGTSPDATHRIRITAYPGPGRGPLGRVELVGRGGQVIWSCEDFAAGMVELNIPGLSERGYMTARAFGADVDPAQWRNVKQVAISNPVYLHPRGEGFTPGMQTAVQLTIREGSPFRGGQVRFEAMDGQLLGTARAKGTLSQTLPAGGRLTLVGPDGRRRTDYLANANAPLQNLQRYLYRGRFLGDYPHLQSGDVSLQAWRLDDYRAALQRVELTY